LSSLGRNSACSTTRRQYSTTLSWIAKPSEKGTGWCETNFESGRQRWSRRQLILYNENASLTMLRYVDE